MDLTDIAYIYVAAYGVIAGIGVAAVAWLVWAWRTGKRDQRRSYGS